MEGIENIFVLMGEKGKKHHSFIAFENNDVASILIPNDCCKLSRNAKNVEVKNK